MSLVLLVQQPEVGCSRGKAFFGLGCSKLAQLGGSLVTEPIRQEAERRLAKTFAERGLREVEKSPMEVGTAAQLGTPVAGISCQKSS